MRPNAGPRDGNFYSILTLMLDAHSSFLYTIARVELFLLVICKLDNKHICSYRIVVQLRLI